MARRSVVETYDDIDGTPLETEGETISFAADGVEYTIDLNKKNAKDFRKKIDYYVEHATRVGGTQAERRHCPTHRSRHPQQQRHPRMGHRGRLRGSRPRPTATNTRR